MPSQLSRTMAPKITSESLGTPLACFSMWMKQIKIYSVLHLSSFEKRCPLEDLDCIFFFASGKENESYNQIECLCCFPRKNPFRSYVVDITTQEMWSAQKYEELFKQLFVVVSQEKPRRHEEHFTWSPMSFMQSMSSLA